MAHGILYDWHEMSTVFGAVVQFSGVL